MHRVRCIHLHCTDPSDCSVSCWLWKKDTCTVSADPAVHRDTGSICEVSSALQEGFRDGCKDPSAIAALPGCFC